MMLFSAVTAENSIIAILLPLPFLAHYLHEPQILLKYFSTIFLSEETLRLKASLTMHRKLLAGFFLEILQE